MNNDLKNFLDVETKNITQYAYFVDHQSEEELTEVIMKHNTRLINFVLELVEKEVKEYKNRIGMPSGFGESAVRADASRDTLDYISTIINNLRV